jgi:tetratricopeptide (TPR) repeat protein
VAPLVLSGRALSALGKHTEAHARFAAAIRRDKTSLEEPAALLAYAQSAQRSGKSQDATSAYRALVPRIALLETPWQRQLAAIEAGFSAMDAGALPKAVGVLTEARRRETVPGLSDLVAAVLALALDRQGRSEEARGVAQEVSGVEAIRFLAADKASGVRPHTPVLESGQLWACVALLEEGEDRAAARESWKQFLSSAAGKGRSRAHAQTHLDQLTGVKRSR